MSARDYLNRAKADAVSALGDAIRFATYAGASDVEMAQLHAARALLADLTKFPIYPSPDDFRAAAQDLIYIADAVDPLILAIGKDAADNCNSSAIDKTDVRDNFTRPLFNALDGNATWNLERAADELADAMREEAAEHA